MIVIRLLRFIVCLVLTIPCWLVAAFFVVFVINWGTAPSQKVSVMPNDVYYWLKNTLTSIAIGTINFLKNEII